MKIIIKPQLHLMIIKLYIYIYIYILESFMLDPLDHF